MDIATQAVSGRFHTACDCECVKQGRDIGENGDRRQQAIIPATTQGLGGMSYPGVRLLHRNGVEKDQPAAL